MTQLSQGDELSLTTAAGESLARVSLGIGWDKERAAGFIGSGKPDVDLDASAFQFAGGELFDLAFYNNLTTRDGSVQHLGDNITGRGEGDDEVVVVDLEKVYPRVDTILFMVSSYQGHSLEWVSRAYCRLVDEERETELARLTLTLGVPETGLVMAKLVRDGSGADSRWRMQAVGRGIAATVPSSAVEALRPFV